MNNTFGKSKLTRRHMLKSTAAAAAASLWAGPGISLAKASTESANPGNQPSPAGALTSVPITVSSTAVGSISPAFVGLAYSKEKVSGSFFTASDSTLIGIFNRIGPSCLRIGGSTVDECIWDPTGPGGQSGLTAPSDVNNLAAFLKATKWTCIYGVNLGGAATGATNPSMAAAEVAYVAEKLGPALIGVEIGNEPDLYGRPTNPFPNGWSFDEYIALWSEFRKAIVTLTPGVPIAGPADAGNPLTWTVPFIEVAGKQKVQLVTQHYYVANALAANATTTELLQVGLHKDLMEELAAINAACKRIGVPFRMGECGDFYNNTGTAAPVNVAGSYTASLWGLDYMFMCAQGGAAGVNFECGGDVPGYPPLLNIGDAIVCVSPLFYAMLMMTMAGTGTVLETVVSPGSLNVTGYAIRTPAGGYSLVVLNKESTANIELQIELPESVTEAKLMEMSQLSAGATKPDLLATSGVRIQGAEVTVDGSFSPTAPYQLVPNSTQVMCYVPALTAVLIQVS
jgi:hypothetical protein